MKKVIRFEVGNGRGKTFQTIIAFIVGFLLIPTMLVNCRLCGI